MDTKKLRQKILDLAIRGKLVPQDPNDEPASLLLEHIRAEKERLIKEGKIKRSKKTDKNTSENEETFELPSNWTICKLEDIAYIGTGATPDTRNKDYYNGNIPWVSSSCTKNDYIDSPTSFISQKAINETNCQIYPKGTLIMAMYGEGKTRGQVGELRIDAATNQACAAIMPYHSSFTQYIKLYLKRSYLNIRQQAEGGLQPNLNLSKIAQYDIPLPPLAEQKRIANEIVHLFSVIDELESNEDNLLKAIDKAKFKILDLAIHGKLVPQDPNDEPAIELLKRINPKFEPCDNELDDTQLPDNWCWTTLGNIFNHNTGKALNKSDSQEGSLLPYITTSNVYWNRFDLSEIKKMYFKDSEIDKCTITKGDLLVCEGGDIGRSAIWSFDYDICIQNHIHRLRAKGDVSQLLYLYVLMFYKWTDRIRGNGIGLQGLSSGLLNKMIVPLPPYQEQLRIVSKIEALFSVLDEIKESLT